MTNKITENTIQLEWPKEGVTRVPFDVYMDQAIYDREQEKIYRWLSGRIHFRA